MDTNKQFEMEKASLDLQLLAKIDATTSKRVMEQIGEAWLWYEANNFKVKHVVISLTLSTAQLIDATPRIPNTPRIPINIPVIMDGTLAPIEWYIVLEN